MYLTDEGWYTKAAKNLVMLGHADASTDFVPVTHTYGFVLLCRLLFDQFGVNLLLLRGLNLALSGAGVLFLCWGTARRWGPHLAYCVGLGLVCNLLLISLTRLALPDTTAFALFTLAVATRLPVKRRVWQDLVCVVLAIALSFVKTSYLPASLWLTLVCAMQNKQGSPGLGRFTIAVRRSWMVALLLVLLALGYSWIHTNYPIAWAMFSQLNLDGRMVKNPIQWFLNLGYAIGADLWSTGSLGLAIFVGIYARKIGTKTFLGDHKVQALALLLCLNFLVRSLIWYHPPRYGLVSALAVLGLSVLALQRALASTEAPPVKLGSQWLGWMLAGQLPLAVALAQNGVSGDSMRQGARAIVETMNAHPQVPQILYGTGTASYVALFSPKLHAIDISERAKDLCARIAHYGSGFLLVDDRKAQDFELFEHLLQCPGELRLKELASYQVLNNYYHQGPWRLYQLSWSGPPAKQ